MYVIITPNVCTVALCAEKGPAVDRLRNCAPGFRMPRASRVQVQLVVNGQTQLWRGIVTRAHAQFSYHRCMYCRVRQ